MAPKVNPNPVVTVPKPVDNAPPPANTADAAPADATTKVADSFDPKSANPTYEISSGKTYSTTELKQIAKSDPELATAIGQAQTSYRSLLDKGAKLSVTTSAGNGGKPVITVIPPALANNKDPSVKFNVQIHYHGMDGMASKPSGDSHSTQAIADTFNQKPPTVFVLPEWKSKDNWSNVKNTGTTAKDALKGVVGQAGQTTVSAHSLGRMAVFSAIKNGGLKADRLDMEDAFYKGQRDGPQAVAGWIKQHANDTPPPQVRILVTTNGRMSDKQSIQDEARNSLNPKNGSKVPTGLDLPDSLFDDRHNSKNLVGDHHWAAELTPWP